MSKIEMYLPDCIQHVQEERGQIKNTIRNQRRYLSESYCDVSAHDPGCMTQTGSRNQSCRKCFSHHQRRRNNSTICRTEAQTRFNCLTPTSLCSSLFLFFVSSSPPSLFLPLTLSFNLSLFFLSLFISFFTSFFYPHFISFIPSLLSTSSLPFPLFFVPVSLPSTFIPLFLVLFDLIHSVQFFR